MKDSAKEMETTSAMKSIDEANDHPDLEPEVDETIVPDGFVLAEQGGVGVVRTWRSTILAGHDFGHGGQGGGFQWNMPLPG